MMLEIDIDQTFAEIKANPYPFYTNTRKSAPIFYSEKWQGWFLLRYQDCLTVLKNHDHTPLVDESLRKLLDHWVVLENPPNYARMRSVTHKAFSGSLAGSSLSETITQYTEQQLAILKGQSKFDLIEDFLTPLSTKIVSFILRLPTDEVTELCTLAHETRSVLDLTTDPEVLPQGYKSAEKLHNYVQTLIDDYKTKQSDNLIALIMSSADSSEELTPSECHGVAIGLLINVIASGVIDFTNAFSGGMLGLLQNPGQLKQLVSNSEAKLTKLAIKEFIRYSTPIQLTERKLQEDIEIDQFSIKAGEKVYTVFGAANRDPETFKNPEDFDISRTPNPHIAFGIGARSCFGQGLIHLQGETILPLLLKAMPSLQLATDEYEYFDSWLFRGLTKLPLTISMK